MKTTTKLSFLLSLAAGCSDHGERPLYPEAPEAVTLVGRGECRSRGQMYVWKGRARGPEDEASLYVEAVDTHKCQDLNALVVVNGSSEMYPSDGHRVPADTSATRELRVLAGPFDCSVRLSAEVGQDLHIVVGGDAERASMILDPFTPAQARRVRRSERRRERRNMACIAERTPR